MNQPSILYGVQGTGNGHISRARLMSGEFARLGVQVDYLFSGRARAAYFDMEEFARQQYGTGLSFKTRQGRIRKWQTLKSSKPLRYASEVSALRTDRYSLVISDFEPTTAWAAKLRGTPALALGHQYALTGKAPCPPGDFVAKWIVRHFTPANQRIGFHWHPYERLTLPPMIDTELSPISNSQSFTLVYLPFEDQQETVALLQQLRGEHFVVYSPEAAQETQCRNVSIYPLSKNGFHHHLQRCNRVICNTGFELITEALYLGKPVLTKPLNGQFEQTANAMALKELQLATVARQISVLNLDKFIHSTPPRSRIIYPNVARELAEFCLQRVNSTLSPEESNTALAALAARLWSQVAQPSGVETLSVGDAPTLAAA
ncbi:MJ1255/VC2487 family glycosyltransferase [Granulosicoccus sp. 3-233]|uniref:MJ1255/VC2487 family glycosyltransferase n=1 Tax=Granulosicoccus sp. 3-233 TaxID=3417969 RepID=UPI003D326471